jgi:hypothetical protein
LEVIAMTWHLPEEHGTLTGAEAELFVASVASIYDMMLQEVVDGADQWEFGISAFDGLKWHQRLALLVDVSEAMLREDVPAPDLTSVRESVVGAICENVCQQLDTEIDFSNGKDGPKEDWEYYWRRLVLACWDDSGGLSEDEQAIEETCSDSAVWRGLAEDGFSSSLLWDYDWLDDHFHDMEPAKAASFKDQFNIPQDYYTDIAPDPKLSEIPSLVERVDILLAPVPSSVRLFAIGFRPNVEAIARMAAD